jgi:aminopeptidase YwaD
MSQETERFLKDALYKISQEIGTRPIGSAANERARAYIKDTLLGLGYSVTLQEFTKEYSAATLSRVIVKSDAIELDSWPAFGTRSGNVTAQIINCGQGSDTVFQAAKGKIALLERGGMHEESKMQLLVENGAVGALFYVDHENALYSARVSKFESDIPAAVIRKSDADRLSARFDEFVSLQIDANLVLASCANIIARHPDEHDSRILLCAHYDSRPNTPGANDNASGVACLLGAARAISNIKSFGPIDFISFDGEEIGLVGSRFYAKSDLAKHIKIVLNIDAVGDGRLSCLTKDRDGELDAELANHALAIAAAEGIKLKTATAKTGTSDHAPLRELGARTFWLSDHPNRGRETDIDVASRIRISDLSAVVTLTTKMISSLQNNAVAKD